MDTSRTPTILVIEDDPSIAQLTSDTHGDEGYRVLVADTIDDACALLTACQCGLVLSDTVGGRSPADVAFWGGLETIRDAAQGTPVVIFSAHSADRFAGYRERGFACLLPKPFDLDDLLATVRRFAGSRAA